MSPTRVAGALWRRWCGYWFAPAPLLNLAICRIVVIATLLLVRYDPVERQYGPDSFQELAALPAELYNPLPILHLMIWPVDWRYRPGVEVLEVIFWIGILAGLLALVGLLTNLSLAAFAGASMFLQAHAYSYGQHHHTVAIVVLALCILVVSPCGRVLSLDALLRRARSRRRVQRNQPTVGEESGILQAESRFAGWPLKLIGFVLVLTYLSAAVAKVNPEHGLEWLNGYTLQYYLLRDGLRWEQDFGVWLSQQHGLVTVLSWFTIFFEATFVLALVAPPLAVLYVLAGTGLHLGIYFAMMAPFFGFMALYSAIIPWRRLALAASKRKWAWRRRPTDANPSRDRVP